MLPFCLHLGFVITYTRICSDFLLHFCLFSVRNLIEREIDLI